MLFRLLVVLGAVLSLAEAYKPVVCMHGYSGSHMDFANYQTWLKELHPGQEVYSLNIFEGKVSKTNLWTQLHGLAAKIEEMRPLLKDGYHLVGHSQGALLTRTVLEMIPNNNVENYVSLAGPQLGINSVGYVPAWVADLVHDFAIDIMYTKAAQEHYSAAGFWHDELTPEKYLKDNIFLPVLNNEVLTQNSTAYKENFVQMKKAYFFASPEDGTIVPWYSGIWEYANKQGEILPMEQQSVFTDDLFGLRTLNETGRLSLNVVPGVLHTKWIDDRDVFEKHILPLLY